MMSDTGIPLRVIQEVSGHRTLDELQKYLEVRPEQVRGAIASLSMLSHVGKTRYDDLILNPDLDKPLQEVDRARSSDGELL
jgi:integrase/recombinase XerD